MIRRAFVRMFSGAIFATMLGFKVETWKMEADDDFGLWPTGVRAHFVPWSSLPSAPRFGDRWHNSDTGEDFVFDGERWVQMVGQSPMAPLLRLTPPETP